METRPEPVWIERAFAPQSKWGAILICDGTDEDKFRIDYQHCESVDALNENFAAPQDMSVSNILKHIANRDGRAFNGSHPNCYVAMELLRHFINQKCDPSWIIPDFRSPAVSAAPDSPSPVDGPDPNPASAAAK
jgi:hypothetical protein